jgi:hypothetical protein
MSDPIQEAISKTTGLVRGLTDVLGAMVGVMEPEQRRSIHAHLSHIWSEASEAERDWTYGFLIGRFVDLLGDNRDRSSDN